MRRCSLARGTALWIGVLLGALAPVPAAAQGVPGTVLERFPLEVRAPTGLTWDGSHLWLADLDTARLYRLDPVTGKVVTSLEAPGYQPLGLAWDGTRLWVVDALDGTAYAVDPASGLTTRALPLDTARVKGIAWDGSALWTVDAHAGVVSRLDEEDGTTFASFPSPMANERGDELGLVFDGSQLWVSDRLTDTIYRVDPDSGGVLDSFASPGPYPTGLAWDGSHLWCVDAETRELDQLETESSAPYVVSEPKHELLTYTEAWRNLGPGVVTSLDVYIALPRDLPNQRLLKEPELEPAPAEIVTDRWGQRCAHFVFKDIAAGQAVSATMTVDATLYKVRWYVDPGRVGGLDEIPAEIRETYTRDSSKLVTSDPVIQRATQEALNGETNPYWMARRINRYIQDQMHYELVGGWNVAPTVLARGSGSCSEYTFVMLAMCHAAGLPARYAGSVVIRGDDASRDDVFHRWVEVYLPGYGWFPVDPSGGDSDVPAHVADYFGGLANRFLITTLGAGDSETLGWDYNSAATWTARGRVRLVQHKAGDWAPVGKRYEPQVTAEPGSVPAR
jgi:transglutaminase-like putative cysteine protease/sugar lactone lactonase YvrE